MEFRRHVHALGPTGICFLTILLLRLVWVQPAATPLAQVPRQFGVRPVSSPADGAMREARFWRLSAMQRVSAEFEKQEAWDPAMAGSPRDPVEWRRMMARDPDGSLGRAREHVIRAQRLARTNPERFQAGLLRCRIECERGDFAAELREARKVAALAPRNELALITLERAAACSGQGPLARQARSTIRALCEEKVERWAMPECAARPARTNQKE